MAYYGRKLLNSVYSAYLLLKHRKPLRAVRISISWWRWWRISTASYGTTCLRRVRKSTTRFRATRVRGTCTVRSTCVYGSVRRHPTHFRARTATSTNLHNFRACSRAGILPDPCYK